MSRALTEAKLVQEIRRTSRFFDIDSSYLHGRAAVQKSAFHSGYSTFHSVQAASFLDPFGIRKAIYYHLLPVSLPSMYKDVSWQ